jgi:alkylation response protein AidB-like acyl-CoA dehydrogenase
MTEIQSLTLTEEQQALRDIARTFLADRLGPDVVRELMAGEVGFDPAHWAEVAGMGWQAMVVPEEHGGAGYGWTELAVLFEEAGRAIAPLPLLSTAMGTAVLLSSGTDAQRAEHLPAIAAGDRHVAVAVDVPGADAHPAPTLRDGRLDGRVRHVVEGAAADLVVVATPDAAVLVDPAADGVEVTAMEVLDLTRPQAELTFDAVVVDDDAHLAGSPAEVVDRARTVGATLVANEQVGTAAAVHEMAVEYARTRTQFGRAIGSFQAIKHLLADDLVALEAARSVAWHAARALAADDADEIAVATPMAASLCNDVAAKIAADTIQVHGGIGFTWEHDAHLYFKRASSSRLLFGTPKAWRARLADTLGL